MIDAVRKRKSSPLKPGVCAHCKRNRLIHRRSLCTTCYYKPDIRVQYSRIEEGFRSDGRRYSVGTRDTPTPRVLPEPTDALPGTPEKIAVLLERLSRGQILWHPLDARHRIS